MMSRDPSSSSEFFRREYRLDYFMHHIETDTISIWDGIVMGGGVGISIAAKYRVATETTLWSMPEVCGGVAMVMVMVVVMVMVIPL